MGVLCSWWYGALGVGKLRHVEKLPSMVHRWLGWIRRWMVGARHVVLMMARDVRL